MCSVQRGGSGRLVFPEVEVAREVVTRESAFTLVAPEERRYHQKVARLGVTSGLWPVTRLFGPDHKWRRSNPGSEWRVTWA
jgi:hypothetical protein